MFVGAAAQVIGTSHEKYGMPCQDAARYWRLERQGWAGLVLCDGAGSCQHSHLGAQAICDWFPCWIEQTPALFEEKRQRIADSLMDGMGATLTRLAEERKVPILELSSTFLAIVCRSIEKGLEYRVFHLGDGIAAIIDPQGEAKVSAPDNGEFANETVFTTSSSAARRLRMLAGSTAHGSGFALMSDGSAASLYLKARGELAPAVVEMLHWFEREKVETVVDALESNICSLFRQKTGDDCSLALMLDQQSESPFVTQLA